MYSLLLCFRQSATMSSLNYKQRIDIIASKSSGWAHKQSKFFLPLIYIQRFNYGSKIWQVTSLDRESLHGSTTPQPRGRGPNVQVLWTPTCSIILTFSDPFGTVIHRGMGRLYWGESHRPGQLETGVRQGWLNVLHHAHTAWYRTMKFMSHGNLSMECTATPRTSAE